MLASWWRLKSAEGDVAALEPQVLQDVGLEALAEGT